MPLDIGYIELTGGTDVVVRIYYQQGYAGSPNDAPLVDGPRGVCLDMTNTSGRNTKLVVSGLGANPVTINVGQGDPVTSGPASGRSRTAAQMASLGFTTRGDVGSVELG